MEDTKKTIEAAKPEELAERAPLTDDQLDQASGGTAYINVAEEKISNQLAYDNKVVPAGCLIGSAKFI